MPYSPGGVSPGNLKSFRLAAADESSYFIVFSFNCISLISRQMRSDTDSGDWGNDNA